MIDIEHTIQADGSMSHLTREELGLAEDIFVCEYCEKRLTTSKEVLFWRKAGFCSEVCNVFFHVRQNQEAHIPMFNNLTDAEIEIFKASSDPAYE